MDRALEVQRLLAQQGQGDRPGAFGGSLFACRATAR